MAKITRVLPAKSRLPAAKPIKKAAAKPAPARVAKKPAGKKPAKIKPWTAAEVYEAFSRFRNANPEPKGELEHLNAYTLLVAVVLSAQATDAGVNKATRALFAVADTPEKMLALGEDKVRDYIKTIGLYRNKAKNVIALSQKLIAEFGGEVPRTRAEIEPLPGAGRKTSNVVLNMAYGEHTMAVDTHV
ncbi:MAG: endonuclease III, partial [Bradyrhizobium sp.]|nr:endonuclease III [Bradyrhizobium sp.]